MRALCAFALGAVLSISACDCNGGGVGNTTAGFRTTTSEIDFGAALEGTTIVRTLELSSTGRSDVTVEVTTAAPFSAPESIDVLGGATAELTITFTAGTTVEEKTLTLASHGESFDVKLRGEGVHPLDCVPSARCREAHFSLESRQCEESISTDGTACTPEDICLENGVCHSGDCLGTPRTCSDGNACTQDACSSDVGCIHVDVSAMCPKSANPCEVATCDTQTGCGTAPAQDESICGSVDCVTAHLCTSGVCKELPTPEGFLCLPATPCQGEGHCTMGQCVRPDAGVMTPSWSVSLGQVPAPPPVVPGAILPLNGNLYFRSCDLASQDGGCALLSYTSNGFVRYETPIEQDSTLHAITSSGAVVTVADELRAYANSSGAQVWSLPLSSLADGGLGVARVGRDSIGVMPDGRVLLSVASGEGVPGGEVDAGELDGGSGDAGPPDAGFTDAGGALSPSLLLVEVNPTDGGVEAITPIPDGGAHSALALSPTGDAWLWGDGVLAFASGDPDGGWSAQTKGALDGGRVLSTGALGSRAFFGGSIASVDPDGGLVVSPPMFDADAGNRALDFEVLSGAGVAFTFFDSCGAVSPATCTDADRSTWVRAFSPTTGTQLWTAKVLPADSKGALVEAALAGGPLAGAIATVTQAELDGGPRADLQLFAAGQRLILCPLEGTPHVGSALLDSGNLYVLVERSGAWRIEAYPLKGISFLQTGWFRTASQSGSRREQ